MQTPKIKKMEKKCNETRQKQKKKRGTVTYIVTYICLNVSDQVILSQKKFTSIEPPPPFI